MPQFTINNSGTAHYVYDLSDFSSQSVPVLELKFPPNYPVYLIPSDKDYYLLKKNNQLSQYQLYSFLDPKNENNTSIFGIINSNFKRFIQPTSAWSNSSATTLSYYNSGTISSPNISPSQTVTLNYSQGFTETIVAEDPNGNTAVIEPTASTIPYILINGQPLITIQQYLSKFTQLSSYKFSLNTSLVSQSIVTSSVTNGWLTSEQIQYITGLYNVALDMCGSQSNEDMSDAQVGAYVSSVQSAIYGSVNENQTSSSTAYIDSTSSTIVLNQAELDSSGSNDVYASVPFMYYTTGTNYTSTNVSCTCVPLARSIGNTNFVYQYRQGGWNWNNWVQNSGNFSPNLNDYTCLYNGQSFSVTTNWTLPMLNTISTPLSNVPWPGDSNGYLCEVWIAYHGQSFPGTFNYSSLGSSNFCSTNVSWNYTMPETIELEINGVTSWLYNSKTQPWFEMPTFGFITPPQPSVYYNFITDGTGSGGLMYLGYQASFISFNTFTYKQVFGSLQRNTVTASISIPIINVEIVPLKTKYNVPDDEDDFTKLSEGYYNTGNLMVSAYYNSLLSKAKYIVNESDQNSTPTPLQYILSFAMKFSFLRDLFSEWVNGHPFKYVPKTTSQLVYSVNASLPSSNQISDDQALDAIDTFFSTVVPNSTTAYDYDSSTISDNTAAINQFAKISGEDVSTLLDFTSVPTLLPSVFRLALKKVFAMGAFLDTSHGYLSLLKLHQAALQNDWTVSSSDQAGCLPPVTETSMSAMFTSQNHANFDKAKFDMEDHVSSDMHPLIYPLFDDVIEDIKSDIDGIRYLTEGRLHGMSYDLYQPELKTLMQKRIHITHEFIHLFTKSLHFVEDFVSAIDNAANWVNSKLSKPINTLILKPIGYIAVGIAKFAASAMLDMTSLVSPGSEILDIASDANIMRPLPYPLSPFGTMSNTPFKNRVLNSAIGSQGVDPASIECFVPYIGLTGRAASCNAKVYYNGQTQQYSLLLTPPGYVKTNTINGVEWSGHNGNSYSLRLNNVTPGLHCVRLLTTAGTVRMWYSATMTLDPGTRTSFINNPDVNVDGVTSKNQYICSSGFFCFVPDMVVNLDSKISLPKSMKKWVLTSIALKGLFTKGPQTSEYVAAIKELSTIPGFDNVTSHVSMGAYVAACAADAAAGSASAASAIGTIIESGSYKQGMEDMAISVEDMMNIGRCTTIYDEASGVNVMNAVATQMYSSVDADGNLVPGINNEINFAWGYDGANVREVLQYSMSYYNLFSDTIIDTPDFNVPQWYPESWQRLFGDIMLAVSKVAYFLHAQHKVFKKWSKNGTPQQQKKVSLRSILVNKIKKKYQNHKLIKGVDASLSKLNHGFMSDPNLEGLRSYEMSSNKSIKSILSDDTSLTSIVKSLVGSPGARGIN